MDGIGTTISTRRNWSRRRRGDRGARIEQGNEILPALENIPKTDPDWKFWAWHHRDSHDRIRAAIAKQKGVTLTDYQVEPINPNDMTSFLQNNSNLHDDMNSALGLQTTNLQDADLGNEKELDAWIRLHYLEHFDAETAAGV